MAREQKHRPAVCGVRCTVDCVAVRTDPRLMSSVSTEPVKVAAMDCSTVREARYAPVCSGVSPNRSSVNESGTDVKLDV